MAEVKILIEGMHCGGCVRRVTQALAATDGVTVNEVTVGSATLTTTQEPAPVEELLATVAKLGFPARLAS